MNGWFNELGKYGKEKYSLNTDAKNFIKLAKKYKLEVGFEPKVGSIIVWSGGSNGHVAGVISVNSNKNEIETIESGWKSSKPYWTAKHIKGLDNSWTIGTEKYWMGNKYKFLGFIYHPDYGKIDHTNKKPNLILDGKFIYADMVNISHTNYIKLRELEKFGKAKVLFNKQYNLPEIIFK